MDKKTINPKVQPFWDLAPDADLALPSPKSFLENIQ